MKRNLSVALCLFFALAAVTTANAQNAPAAQEGPPLPLHAVEGYGGVLTTYSAYLVNPGNNAVGLPSVGGIFVLMNHERSLSSLTLTETLCGRLELGYGFNSLALGDLPDDIQDATGVGIGDDNVMMNNFNARILMLKEGEFGAKWVPALTAGAHYKSNATVDDIDDELGGALTDIGIDDSEGVDFTLYASKMITALPRPVLVNAGVRATKGAHLGLLGFTDEYKFVAEGNVAVLATDRLIVAAEYRQKPNEYTSIPGLIDEEDDWWTAALGYVVNSHFTVALGYGHFGDLLNHPANDSFGLALKYEF